MLKNPDKIIAEALGICLHEWKESQLSPYSLPIRYKCEKCGEIGFGTPPVNPDFSTWPGFGVIMERGKAKKWFFNFLCYYGFFTQDGTEGEEELLKLINPINVFNDLSLWLSENEGEWREK